jgi:hypothetical protein
MIVQIVLRRMSQAHLLPGWNIDVDFGLRQRRQVAMEIY